MMDIPTSVSFKILSKKNDLPIKNQNLPTHIPQLSLTHSCCNRYIIKETETHSLIMLRMVTRWADNSNRILDLSCRNS